MTSVEPVIALRVAGDVLTVRLTPGSQLDVVRHADHRPERFLWRSQQRHIPGFWWSSTNKELVPHESQLERRRVLLADFDLSVVRIVSQPFDLYVGGVLVQCPDFLLVHRDASFTVVNVKLPSDAAQPKVREQFAEVTRCVSDVGWVHEVWTGDDSDFARNVDFLSAYMRPQLGLELPVRASALDGLSIGEATGRLAPIVGEAAHAHVMAALWRHELETDLTVPLSESAVVKAAS